MDDALKPDATNKEAFAIDEVPLSLPPGLETVDLAQRIRDDVRVKKRLRDMLNQTRAEHQEAMRKLLLKLLEVADALDRIVARQPDPASAPDTQQWKSIRVTRLMLAEALKLQRVVPIEMLDKEVDPALCEVEGAEVRTDVPEGTVVQEIVKGYRWGDNPEPLRPAVVIVSTSSSHSEK